LETEVLKRLKRSTVIAAGIVGLLTAASFAFFVGSFAADGSHEGTTGSGGTGARTLPVAVNFPSGELTPTHPIEVSANVENTTQKAVVLHAINTHITTGSAACPPSEFKIVATGSSEKLFTEVLEGNQHVVLNYAPGTDSVFPNPETHIMLEIPDNGKSQEACEGASVKVALEIIE
jgi:hypothetical protein